MAYVLDDSPLTPKGESAIPRVNRLEHENTALRNENAELQAHIEALQRQDVTDVKTTQLGPCDHRG